LTSVWDVPLVFPTPFSFRSPEELGFSPFDPCGYFPPPPPHFRIFGKQGPFPGLVPPPLWQASLMPVPLSGLLISSLPFLFFHRSLTVIARSRENSPLALPLFRIPAVVWVLPWQHSTLEALHNFFFPPPPFFPRFRGALPCFSGLFSGVPVSLGASPSVYLISKKKCILVPHLLFLFPPGTPPLALFPFQLNWASSRFDFPLCARWCPFKCLGTPRLERSFRNFARKTALPKGSLANRAPILFL